MGWDKCIWGQRMDGMGHMYLGPVDGWIVYMYFDQKMDGLVHMYLGAEDGRVGTHVFGAR